MLLSVNLLQAVMLSLAIVNEFDEDASQQVHPFSLRSQVAKGHPQNVTFHLHQPSSTCTAVWLEFTLQTPTQTSWSNNINCGTQQHQHSSTSRFPNSICWTWSTLDSMDKLLHPVGLFEFLKCLIHACKSNVAAAQESIWLKYRT